MSMFDEAERIIEIVDSKEKLKNKEKEEELVKRFRLALLGFSVVEETDEYDSLTVEELYAKIYAAQHHINFMNANKLDEVNKSYTNLRMSLKDDFNKIGINLNNFINKLKFGKFVKRCEEPIEVTSFVSLIFGGLMAFCLIFPFSAGDFTSGFVMASITATILAVSGIGKILTTINGRSKFRKKLEETIEANNSKIITAIENDESFASKKVGDFKKNAKTSQSSNLEQALESVFGEESEKIIVAAEKLKKNSQKKYA